METLTENLIKDIQEYATIEYDWKRIDSHATSCIISYGGTSFMIWYFDGVPSLIIGGSEREFDEYTIERYSVDIVRNFVRYVRAIYVTFYFEGEEVAEWELLVRRKKAGAPKHTLI